MTVYPIRISILKYFTVALICALIFSSCNEKTSQTADHHEHGSEPLSYTLYSDKTELFVEFNPMVAGKSVSFAAHFTVLGDKYLPLTEGTVTLSLITGVKGVRVKATEPSSPGIFRLALKPLTPGKGKLVFEIETKTYLDTIVIDNVEVFPDENSIRLTEAAHSGNEITYLKEQAWKTEFANMPVRRIPFQEVIYTSGVIRSAPGDVSAVAATASGIIRFADGIFPGISVKQGQNLFVISGNNLTTGNPEINYQSARALYEKAKKDYERASELIKDKIISEREFQQVKLEFENAERNYQLFAKNYTSAGIVIKSPLSGFITELPIGDGSFVEPGALLAYVSPNNRLILSAEVSSRFFDRLPDVKSATFKIAGTDTVYNTDNLNGRIISYGKQTGSGTAYLPVNIEMKNPGNIIPGNPAEIYLKTNAVSEVLVLPLSSLIEEQGKFYVYVQVAGESFDKREVLCGPGDGVNVQVLSGISEGERVVTKGAYNIKLSSASGALPAHGHVH